MDHPAIALSAPTRPPTGRRYFPPIATYVILTLNFFIFALMTHAGGSKNVDVLLTFGASYGPYFRAGQYWRLVMPMFLHIGWEHLITNMFALWLLGNFLEPLYGYGRFTLFYVFAGMGGALLSMEASSHIAAGASGAIFGIAGAMLVTGLLHPETIPRRWKDVFGIGILLVIILNLAFGHFVHHIDNWAHLGGLITGLVMAWFIPPVRASLANWSSKSFQPIVALPVAIVIIGMGAAANHAHKAREVTSLLQASANLQSTGNLDAAHALVARAHSLEPRDPRVQEALGNDALDAHRYDEAIRYYSAVLRVNPYLPAVAIRLATAYEAKNDVAKAREILESSAAKMPGNAAILEALGEVSVRLKLYPEAIERYQQALKIAPDSALTQNNLAWLYATCDDPHFRDPAKAIQHALRAVQLTGGRLPAAIDTLAAAFYASARYRDAATTEARAVELDPGNPLYRQNLLRYRLAGGITESSPKG
ncbi:MAG: rhomboid family intramembrane serine protease [Acidobacteriota bacterium]|nr:rhomboid family intramembrane serine protease [Acidobacteriota bacterium]